MRAFGITFALCIALAPAAVAEDCSNVLPRLEQALLKQPESIEALLSLGVNRFRCGLPEPALEPLKKTLNLAPNNSTAYFYLGVCLLALDREKEAKQAFRAMAALTPADADQLYLIQKGYARLSSALLERMSEISPHSARLNQVRAELYDMEKQPAKAVDEYKQAVETDPNRPDLHYALGNAYWVRFQRAEAVTQFQAVIRLSPTHYMAHYKLGLALLELNRVPEAIVELQQAVRIQPGFGDANFALGKSYLQSGDNNAALKAIDAGLQVDPNNQTGRYLRAQILRKLGRNQEADAQLQQFRTRLDHTEQTKTPTPR